MKKYMSLVFIMAFMSLPALAEQRAVHFEKIKSVGPGLNMGYGTGEVAPYSLRITGVPATSSVTGVVLRSNTPESLEVMNICQEFLELAMELGTNQVKHHVRINAEDVAVANSQSFIDSVNGAYACKLSKI